jgi:hypothetical protein
MQAKACAHRCKDKRICKHRCCKRNLGDRYDDSSVQHSEASEIDDQNSRNEERLQYPTLEETSESEFEAQPVRQNALARFQVNRNVSPLRSRISNYEKQDVEQRAGGNEHEMKSSEIHRLRSEAARISHLKQMEVRIVFRDDLF